MTDDNSIDYYLAREQHERDLAKVATNPAIAKIHLEMATRYAQLTARPTLRRRLQS